MTDHEPTLTDYIFNGPKVGGDSILRRTVGLWLWWRMWLVSIIAVVSIFLVLPLGLLKPPYWGYFVGLVTMMLVNAVGEND